MSEDQAPDSASASPEPAPAPRKHGTGWARDAADARDRTSAALLGAPANLPPEALGLKELVTRVNDQKTSSSCVGQAIAKAIHVRLRKIKPPGAPEPAEPSSLSIYTPARRRATGPAGPLVDQGCAPRDAMMSIRDVGVAREETWPFDLAAVDVDVPWDELQDASKFLVFEWYRVMADGAHRSDAVAQAVAKGFPVVFGLDLWQGFEDYAGGTLLEVGPDSVGGHMLCIVGYRTRADGKREFLIINSWSDQWGEGGFVWLHEDVIASPRADDFYVIQVAA